MTSSGGQQVLERACAERRKQPSKDRPATPALYRTEWGGYERWLAYNRTEGQDSCYVHRLVAVAEWGIEAVRDKDIHHKNGVPWDNRPENLEPLTRKEHREVHGEADPSHKIAESELIKDLQAGAVMLGRAPTWEEYNTFGKYHAQTVSKRFGGWSEAVAAAGLGEDMTAKEIEQLYFGEVTQ
jgi:hypothetical protein